MGLNKIQRFILLCKSCEPLNVFSKLELSFVPQSLSQLEKYVEGGGFQIDNVAWRDQFSGLSPSQFKKWRQLPNYREIHPMFSSRSPKVLLIEIVARVGLSTFNNATFCSFDTEKDCGLGRTPYNKNNSHYEPILVPGFQGAVD